MALPGRGVGTECSLPASSAHVGGSSACVRPIGSGRAPGGIISPVQARCKSTPAGLLPSSGGLTGGQLLENAQQLGIGAAAKRPGIQIDLGSMQPQV